MLLDVQRLSVDIPTAQGVLHAVQGISFSVDKGETLCIVGESGCGKSLTALALMDLLPRRAVRSADRLAFSGVDLQSLPADAMNKLRGEHMAMIFQEPMTSLNPVFTIGDQMADVLRQHLIDGDAEADVLGFGLLGHHAAQPAGGADRVIRRVLAAGTREVADHRHVVAVLGQRREARGRAERRSNSCLAK